MGESKNFENRIYWYALYLCIIKKISADDALRLMGESL